MAKEGAHTTQARMHTRTYLASCRINVTSSFTEVTRSCGEEYICSLITGNGLVATANGGGFTVSTLLRSLFNIRLPAISNRKQQMNHLMVKLSHV